MRISDKAVAPNQYDLDELVWAEEAGKENHIRRLFAQYLNENFLRTVAGKRVLDVGSGLGWLCQEIEDRGARATGIEPSARNVELAHQLHPGIEFIRSSFQDLDESQQFDAITAIMVFEHLPNLAVIYKKLRRLLVPGGSFVLIAADFDKMVKNTGGYDREYEKIQDDEVAIKTDYRERAGTIYDIVRTPHFYISCAEQNGFVLQKHLPIKPPEWLKKEKPFYDKHTEHAIFHYFEFEAIP